MQYNWITGDNRVDRATFAELGEGFGSSGKNIKRWVELDFKDVSTVSRRFPQLAEFLTEWTGVEVTVEEIAARFRKAQALKKCKDRDISDSQRQLLRVSLDSCESAQIANSLSKSCGSIGSDELLEKLTSSDHAESATTFTKLKAAIVHVADNALHMNELAALRQLIYSIGVFKASPVLGPEDTGVIEYLEDPGPICLLRLHIDSHVLSKEGGVPEGFTDNSYLQAKPTRELQDSAPNSARTPVVKNTNLDYRLWRVARRLDDPATFCESQVPRPYTQAKKEEMYQYLSRFNSSISDANNTGKHYLLCVPPTESKAFLNHLKSKVKSLRIFQTAEQTGIPLFSIDKMDAEVWLAETLYACQKREEILKNSGMNVSTHEKPLDDEESKMTEPTVNQQFNITTFTGNIGPNGRFTNNAPTEADVLSMLQSTLDDTDGANEQHKPLRAIIRQIQSEVETGAKPDVDKLDAAVKTATLLEKTTKAFHTLLGILALYGAGSGGSSAP